jgi:hypothetical protein
MRKGADCGWTGPCFPLRACAQAKLCGRMRTSKAPIALLLRPRRVAQYMEALVKCREDNPVGKGGGQAHDRRAPSLHHPLPRLCLLQHSRRAAPSSQGRAVRG